MSPRTSLLIILGITLWRIVGLIFDRTDLFVDEAQYWLWSQHLDFGYYSKPPMIAWIIRVVTDLAGSDAIFWIRLPGPLIHMATALLLAKLAGRFVSPAIEGWTGVTYATLPGVALSSVFFSTDVPLLLFLAIALYAYLALTEKPSLLHAVLLGLAFGAGFLSKYAILFLVPGGLIALAAIAKARLSWRDCLVAAAVALAIALPNLWWNATHDATTVRHTSHIAQWQDLGIHAGRGIAFFLAQFGVVGPIVFAGLILSLVQALRRGADETIRILLWLSIPVVLLITLQATLAKAYANWAVTAYIAGTVAAVACLARFWPRGLRLSLGINLAASLLFPLATVFADDLTLPGGTQILRRYVGRNEISVEAAGLAERAGVDAIVSDSRDLLADMFHTLREESLSLYALPPAAEPRNYYEQMLALPADRQAAVLFLSDRRLECPQAPPQLIATIQPDRGYYRGRTIFAFVALPACLRPQR